MLGVKSLLAWLLAAAILPGMLHAGVSTSYNYDDAGNRTSATDLLQVIDPRVESFEPRVGIAGDRVVVFGRNLPEGNAAGFVVQFNGVTAPLLAMAPNAITVEVPIGATTGPVVVTFPDLQQTDLGVFNYSGVTIDPPEAEVFFGQTVQFDATIMGSGSDVTWQVRSLAQPNGASAGTINAAGLYTAPSSANAAEFPYLVTATNVQTGRRGHAFIRPACTSLSALELGESVNGLIVTGNERFCYEFDGSTSTAIDLAYYGLSTSARRLRIRGPEGFAVASAGPGVSLRLDEFLPDLDAVYRIEVEAQLGSSGGFLLGFNEAPPPAEIPFNTPTAESISVIGQQDRYSFEGVAGASVTVDYITPTVSARPDHMVRMELVRPNGTVASTIPSCGFVSRLDNILLDQTGTWTIRVRSYESWSSCGYGVDTNLLTGDYTLSVCPSNGPPIPIAYGETASGNYDKDCQVVNFEFEGLAQDIVSAFYVGPTLTRRMRLFAPDGSQLAATGQGVGVSLLDIELPENGTYRISVEAPDSQITGPFTIGLSVLDIAVPIAFNAPVNAGIADIAEVDQYTFSATAGTTVTVDYTTPTVNARPDHIARLELIRPSGTLAATTPSCGFAARMDNILLNESGTWTIRVRSYENWSSCGYGADTDLLTGAYTLSVCPSNAVPIPIEYGGTAGGSYATDCQIVNFEFDGSEGDIVSAFYVGPTITRRMRMFAPDGSQLATTGQGVGVALLDIALPQDGTYRLSAEAADGQTAGPFTIGLSVQGDTVPIALNTPVAGSIDDIAEVDQYTFAGTAGSSLTVDYITPAVLAKPDHIVRLELIRPSGTLAATNPSCGFLNRLDNILLDESGDWTVRVRTYESWSSCGYGADTDLLTGSYTLSVCPSNGPPIPIAYGETASSAFATDCQFVNFEFEGQADDIVSAFYVGPTTTRRIRMFAPDGTLLGTSSQGVGVSLLDIELPLDGTYVIRAEAADSATVGPFTIGLSVLGDAVPAALNTPVSAAIDEIAEVDQYTFNGVTGATVTVDYSTPLVNARPDHIVRLELVRPSGTVAATNPSCGTGNRLDNIVLNETGTWAVRVRTYESWSSCGYGADTDLLTGSYTLSVCPSNGPPTPIAYGEAVDGAFAADCQFVNFEFDGLAGDVVSAFYVGPTTTRRMRLYAPDGTLLGTSGQGLGVALLDIELPVSGTYRITAEAADNQTIGSFTIGLSVLDDAIPITVNSPVMASIKEIAEVDQYTFGGLSGSTVRVEYSTPLVSTRPDHLVRLELIRPSGTVASSTPSCGTTAAANVTLDESGTWTVRVRTYESWASCGYGPDTNLLTGLYTLSVCIPGPCP